MASILEIQSLGFSYRDRVVLEDVTLSVARNSILGVIGPNGGGKTTLIKLILGLLKPERGTIRIDGLTPAQAVARGTIVGYLPQNPTIATQVPIDTRQLVHLGLAGRSRMLHATPPADIALADQLIDDVGLSAARHTPISALSGGQLQRALIARALAARPKLLLLDEPVVGIDHRGQTEFIHLIDRLRTTLGLTVIFVSHDLRAVASISDRIACVSRKMHYHDVPQHLPAELMDRMFACDLAALGLGHVARFAPRCDDPGCDGKHSSLSPLPSVGATVESNRSGLAGISVPQNLGRSESEPG